MTDSMPVFIGLTVETFLGKNVYKVFEVICHGHVSSRIYLSLRNAFYVSSFQE